MQPETGSRNLTSGTSAMAIRGKNFGDIRDVPHFLGRALVTKQANSRSLDFARDDSGWEV